MAPIYSPINPRNINTTPKQKNTEIINVEIPGGVIFLEKVKNAISWIIIAMKQSVAIAIPETIMNRKGAIEVDTIPFIAWS